MARMVNPKPRGPLWMMMGGLSCATSGLSSRLGDVSRELVLEPPGEPSTPECMPLDRSLAAALRSSEGMMSERPDADADLMTERERSLKGGDGVGMGGVAASLGDDRGEPPAAAFSADLVPVATMVLLVAMLAPLLLVLPPLVSLGLKGSAARWPLLVRAVFSATGESSRGSAALVATAGEVGAVTEADEVAAVPREGSGSGRGADKRCWDRRDVSSWSTERANRGKSAMPGRPLRCTWGDTSSDSVCDDSGVLVSGGRPPGGGSSGDEPDWRRMEASPGPSAGMRSCRESPLESDGAESVRLSERRWLSSQTCLSKFSSSSSFSMRE